MKLRRVHRVQTLDHLVRENGVRQREAGAGDQAVLQDVVHELQALVGSRDGCVPPEISVNSCRTREKAERPTREPLSLFARQTPVDSRPSVHMLRSLLHESVRDGHHAVDKEAAVIMLERRRSARLALQEFQAADLGVVALLGVQDVVKRELPEGREERSAENPRVSANALERLRGKSAPNRLARSVRHQLVDIFDDLGEARMPGLQTCWVSSAENKREEEDAHSSEKRAILPLPQRQARRRHR